MQLKCTRVRFFTMHSCMQHADVHVPRSRNMFKKKKKHIREMYKTEFRDGPSRCNLRCASWLAQQCSSAHLLQCTYVQRAHKLRVVKQRRDLRIRQYINKWARILIGDITHQQFEWSILSAMLFASFSMVQRLRHSCVMERMPSMLSLFVDAVARCQNQLAAVHSNHTGCKSHLWYHSCRVSSCLYWSPVFVTFFTLLPVLRLVMTVGFCLV